jgi:hypothetical protein
VANRGAALNALHETLASCEVFEEDEASRPTLVEAIFHPVPNVNKRRNEEARFQSSRTLHE